MDLFTQVSEDIKKAMLAREKVRLEALRGAKKEFLEAKTAKGANGELSDDKAISILVKMVKQLSDAELEAELKAIIAETGASSLKEMGKVMGVASKRLAGRAEGRAINAKVKELLG